MLINQRLITFNQLHIEIYHQGTATFNTRSAWRLYNAFGPHITLLASMNRIALCMVMNGRGFGRRDDFARRILESVFSHGVAAVAVHKWSAISLSLCHTASQICGVGNDCGAGFSIRPSPWDIFLDFAASASTLPGMKNIVICLAACSLSNESRKLYSAVSRLEVASNIFSASHSLSTTRLASISGRQSLNRSHDSMCTLANAGDVN